MLDSLIRDTKSSKKKNTYEARGVVVSDGLGVTVGLQGRVGLDNLLLEGTGVRALGSLGLGGLLRYKDSCKDIKIAVKL